MSISSCLYELVEEFGLKIFLKKEDTVVAWYSNHDGSSFYTTEEFIKAVKRAEKKLVAMGAKVRIKCVAANNIGIHDRKRTASLIPNDIVLKFELICTGIKKLQY